MKYNYNECPECGYIGNVQYDSCPSCGFNLAKYRAELHAQEQAELQRKREEAEMAEKERKYLEALNLFATNEYQSAIVGFLNLGNYKESKCYAEKSTIALFESTIVKEFSENPFLSVLYTFDAQKKLDASDIELKKFVKEEEAIKKLIVALEKYKGKKYIEVEKYIDACLQSLNKIKQLKDILKKEAEEQDNVLKKEAEAQAEAEKIRKRYEEGKKHLKIGAENTQIEIRQSGKTKFRTMNSSEISAIEIFEELGEYEDSLILLEKAKKLCLEKGKKLLESGEYNLAAFWFDNLGNYENAPELLEEIDKIVNKEEKTKKIIKKVLVITLPVLAVIAATLIICL